MLVGMGRAGVIAGLFIILGVAASVLPWALGGFDGLALMAYASLVLSADLVFLASTFLVWKLSTARPPVLPSAMMKVGMLLGLMAFLFGTLLK